MRFFDARPSLNKCTDKCPLKQKHKAHFVYFEYYGKLDDVNIVFVGECPGFSEAKYKQPFYPKAYSGRILRQIIKDLNLQNYGIANIVCCRSMTEKYSESKRMITIKNRTPTEEECKYCVDHLKIFLKYINPKSTIILLGGTSSFFILKNAKQYINECKKGLYINKKNLKGKVTITALTKLSPLNFKGRIFASNFHPRYVAAGGGIGSERYNKYLKRMQDILKINNQSKYEIN